MYENLKGQAIADEIGVSVRSIQNYLKQLQKPDGGVVQKIHEAFAKYQQREEIGSKKLTEEEPMERIYLVESVRNLTESSRISAEAEKMRESNMARLIAILEDQANEIRRINSGKSVGEKDEQQQSSQVFESFSDIKARTGKQEGKGLKKDR